MHVHMYTCTHVHMYTCTHVYDYIVRFMAKPVRTYAFTCLHMWHTHWRAHVYATCLYPCLYLHYSLLVIGIDHMSITCRSHVDHMSITCRTHVEHMSITCRTHVEHMSITCRSHVYIHVYATRPRHHHPDRVPASSLPIKIVEKSLGMSVAVAHG